MNIALKLNYQPGSDTRQSHAELVVGSRTVFSGHERDLTPGQREVVAKIMMAQSEELQEASKRFKPV